MEGEVILALLEKFSVALTHFPCSHDLQASFLLFMKEANVLEQLFANKEQETGETRNDTTSNEYLSVVAERDLETTTAMQLDAMPMHEIRLLALERLVRISNIEEIGGRMIQRCKMDVTLFFPYLEVGTGGWKEKMSVNDVKQMQIFSVTLLCLKLKLPAACARRLLAILGSSVEWKLDCFASSFPDAGSALAVSDKPGNMSVYDEKELRTLSMDLVTRFSGFYLPSPTEYAFSTLKHTETTLKNFEKLVLALNCRKPVLIEGPPGAGKTALIHELVHYYEWSLSQQTRYKFQGVLYLQLDEDTDTKSLLGHYECTETLGEFKFVYGSLSRAVMDGLLVVIEDLNLAPVEVISGLVSLFEQRTLLIPSRQEVIEAHDQFQLVATCATSKRLVPELIERKCEGEASVMKGQEPALSNSNQLLEVDSPDTTQRRCELRQKRTFEVSDQAFSVIQRHWVLVQVVPLLQEELEAVLQWRFNTLPGSLLRKLWLTFNEIQMFLAMRETRQLDVDPRPISQMDLFKLCERIATNVSLPSLSRLSAVAGANLVLTDREKLLLLREVLDCFTAAYHSAPFLPSLCAQLCTIWTLDGGQLLSFYQNQRPVIEANECGALTIGRATLRSENTVKTYANGAPFNFAQTQLCMRLLELVSVSVSFNDPVLLVGETGTGKTELVQQLAKLLNKKLIIVNCHFQTEVSDLIGGFKPVNKAQLAATLYHRFFEFFSAMFSVEANSGFVHKTRVAVTKKRYKKLCLLFKKAAEMARVKLEQDPRTGRTEPIVKKQKVNGGGSVETGSRAMGASQNSQPTLHQTLDRFENDVIAFQEQITSNKSGFGFSFQEGPLLQSLTEGHWILLDEINLAGTETLERLNSLLDSKYGSLTIYERSDVHSVQRHPGFRLFGCMNPANDHGKKALSRNVRSRFSELYVPETDKEEDLRTVILYYTKDIGCIDDAVVSTLCSLYQLLKELTKRKSSLLDGNQERVSYSLRTLCRALVTAKVFLSQNVDMNRSFFEAFVMHFRSMLDTKSGKVVEQLLLKTFAKNLSSKQRAVAFPCPRANGRLLSDKYVSVGRYWIKIGTLDRVEEGGESEFVVTKRVETYLDTICRALVAGKYPILLQGPTSSGKTSVVQYLGRITKNKVIRINNHETTDTSDYFGSYYSDVDGKLKFQVGPFVEAMQKGYWIILDELNLCSSEVLESLNRVLDDNRELFISEINLKIKAHENFAVFATQNPSHKYSGRKQLSRALKNRFVEVNVEELGQADLRVILQTRAKVSQKFCDVMLQVRASLQLERKKSEVFVGKDGFLTIRDLLKWAHRFHHRTEEHFRLTPDIPFDYMKELALEGFYLLGERVRVEDDKEVVRKVLEKCCRCELKIETLYDNLGGVVNKDVVGVVWTQAMKRVYHLLVKCIKNKEPVLLVGETGLGKTLISQKVAQLFGRPLSVVNCHRNSEASDFLGSLRPVRNRSKKRKETRDRLLSAYSDFHDACLENEVTAPSPSSLNVLEDFELAQTIDSQLKRVAGLVEQLQEREEEKSTPSEPAVEATLKTTSNHLSATLLSFSRCLNTLFEWEDGALVKAMISGEYVLLDELSLADDAVLERLNSVLEPSRTLFLAEKPTGGVGSDNSVVAHDSFRIIATMNPGGDHGKKELSPALRNRFTEVWIPCCDKEEDLTAIIIARLQQEPALRALPELCAEASKKLLQCKQVMETSQGMTPVLRLSIRDLVGVTDFVCEVWQKVKYLDSVDQGKVAERDIFWSLFYHAVDVVIVQGLGLGHGLSDAFVAKVREAVSSYVRESQELLGSIGLPRALQGLSSDTICFQNEPTGESGSEQQVFLSCGMFRVLTAITPGQVSSVLSEVNFATQAPTTAKNLFNVVRAMQVEKGVLLEGSPGVGKTSVVEALAHLMGVRLFRVNLSEQTDFSDLVGLDVPATTTESAEAQNTLQFQWSDGPLLEALKTGNWILLDELNLASQAVLEGLNAVLDHRQEIFVPELNRTFRCHPNFRLFATQNPVNQGGGRKGLSKAFLNRFIRVTVQSLTKEDYVEICTAMFRGVEDHVPGLIVRLVAFNDLVNQGMAERKYGVVGGPFDFNLRDIIRWCTLLSSELQRAGENERYLRLKEQAGLLYFSRLRSPEERALMESDFEKVFTSLVDDVENRDGTPCRNYVIQDDATVDIDITPEALVFNENQFTRATALSSHNLLPGNRLTTNALPKSLLLYLKRLAHCVENKWPVLLVGDSCTGKTSLIRTLSELMNQPLVTISASSGTEGTELIGCFEQADEISELKALQQESIAAIRNEMVLLLLEELPLSSTNSSLVLLRDLTKTLFVLQKPNPRKHLSERLSTELASLKAFVLSAPTHDLTRLLGKLEQVLKKVKSLRRQVGKFVWKDGILVTAMEAGRWLVIENVNLISPSVLDRVSSVLESKRELVVNESGSADRIIKAHDNFRVFFTANQRNGELSKAMRNRCVEVALLSKDLVSEEPLEATIESATRYCSASANPLLERLEQPTRDLFLFLSQCVGYESCFGPLIMEKLALLVQSSPRSQVQLQEMVSFCIEATCSTTSRSSLEAVLSSFQTSTSIVSRPLLPITYGAVLAQLEPELAWKLTYDVNALQHCLLSTSEKALPTRASVELEFYKAASGRDLRIRGEVLALASHSETQFLKLFNFLEELKVYDDQSYLKVVAKAPTRYAAIRAVELIARHVSAVEAYKEGTSANIGNMKQLLVGLTTENEQQCMRHLKRQLSSCESPLSLLGYKQFLMLLQTVLEKVSAVIYQVLHQVMGCVEAFPTLSSLFRVFWAFEDLVYLWSACSSAASSIRVEDKHALWSFLETLKPRVNLAVEGLCSLLAHIKPSATISEPVCSLFVSLNELESLLPLGNLQLITKSEGCRAYLDQLRIEVDSTQDIIRDKVSNLLGSSISFQNLEAKDANRAFVGLLALAHELRKVKDGSFFHQMSETLSFASSQGLVKGLLCNHADFRTFLSIGSNLSTGKPVEGANNSGQDYEEYAVVLEKAIDTLSGEPISSTALAAFVEEDVLLHLYYLDLSSDAGVLFHACLLSVVSLWPLQDVTPDRDALRQLCKLLQMAVYVATECNLQRFDLIQAVFLEDLLRKLEAQLIQPAPGMAAVLWNGKTLEQLVCLVTTCLPSDEDELGLVPSQRSFQVVSDLSTPMELQELRGRQITIGNCAAEISKIFVKLFLSSTILRVSPSSTTVEVMQRTLSKHMFKTICDITKAVLQSFASLDADIAELCSISSETLCDGDSELLEAAEKLVSSLRLLEERLQEKPIAKESWVLEIVRLLTDTSKHLCFFYLANVRQCSRPVVSMAFSWCLIWFAYTKMYITLPPVFDVASDRLEVHCVLAKRLADLALREEAQQLWRRHNGRSEGPLLPHPEEASLLSKLNSRVSSFSTERAYLDETAKERYRRLRARIQQVLLNKINVAEMRKLVQSCTNFNDGIGESTPAMTFESAKEVVFQLGNLAAISSSELDRLSRKPDCMFEHRYDIFSAFKASLSMLDYGLSALANLFGDSLARNETDPGEAQGLVCAFPSALTPGPAQDPNLDSVQIATLKQLSKQAMKETSSSPQLAMTLFIRSLIFLQHAGVETKSQKMLLVELFRLGKQLQKNATELEVDDSNLDDEGEDNLKKVFPEFYSKFEDGPNSTAAGATTAGQVDQPAILSRGDTDPSEYMFLVSDAIVSYLTTNEAILPLEILHAEYRALAEQISIPLSATERKQWAFYSCCVDMKRLLACDKESASVNVYTTPAVNEVQRLQAPLLRVVEQVRLLRQRYPENLALQQIEKVVFKLKAVNIFSPLMQFMTGAEMLLDVLYSWEEVANRDNSLKSCIQELTTILISWRQLELVAWEGLLEERDKKLKRRASGFLYDIVGLLGDQSGVEKAKPVRERRRKVLQFLQESTLGDFEQRVAVLQSTVHLLQLSEETTPADIVLMRCWLENVVCYYTQFLPGLREHVKLSTKLVRKNLADFVKLSKWDSRNRYSFKESVRKSHTKLAKFIRQYEAVLTGPAHVFIEQQLDEGLASFEPMSATSLIPLGKLQETTHAKISSHSVVVDQLLNKAVAQSVHELAHRVRSKRATTRGIKRLLTTVVGFKWEVLAQVLPTGRNGVGRPQWLNDMIMSRIGSLSKKQVSLSVKKRAVSDLFTQLKVERLKLEAKLVVQDVGEFLLQEGPENHVHGFQTYMDLLPMSEENTVRPKLLKLFSSCADLVKITTKKFFVNLAQHRKMTSQFAAGGCSEELPIEQSRLAIHVSKSLLTLLLALRGAHAQRLQLGTVFNDLCTSLKNSLQVSPAENRRVLATAKKVCGVVDTLAVWCQEVAYLRTAVRPDKSSAGYVAAKKGLGQYLEKQGSIYLKSVVNEDGYCPMNPAAEVSLAALSEQISKLQQRLLPFKQRLTSDTADHLIVLSHTEVKDVATLLQDLEDLHEKLKEGIQGLPSFFEQKVSGFLRSSLDQVHASTAAPTQLLVSSGLSERPSLCLEQCAVSLSKLVGKVQKLQEKEGLSILGLFNDLLLLTKSANYTSAIEAVKRLLEEYASSTSTLPWEDSAAVAMIASCLNVLSTLLWHVHFKAVCFEYSLTRLHFLLLRVFRTLFSYGFCDAKQEDDPMTESNDQPDTQQASEGTGFGEGQGTEDVSHEIESEEQLLGVETDEKNDQPDVEPDVADVQNEQQPQEQPGDKDEANDNDAEDETAKDGKEDRDQPDEDHSPEENGIEMQADFDGDLADAPDHEDEGESQTDEPPTDQLEDLLSQFLEMGSDDDMSVVDEKQLSEGEDEQEDANGGNEKYEEDSPMEGINFEEELRAISDTEEDKAENDVEPTEDKDKPQMPEADDGNAANDEFEEETEEAHYAQPKEPDVAKEQSNEASDSAENLSEGEDGEEDGSLSGHSSAEEDTPESSEQTNDESKEEKAPPSDSGVQDTADEPDPHTEDQEELSPTPLPAQEAIAEQEQTVPPEAALSEDHDADHTPQPKQSELDSYGLKSEKLEEANAAVKQEEGANLSDHATGHDAMEEDAEERAQQEEEQEHQPDGQGQFRPMDSVDPAAEDTSQQRQLMESVSEKLAGSVDERFHRRLAMIMEQSSGASDDKKPSEQEESDPSANPPVGTYAFTQPEAGEDPSGTQVLAEKGMEEEVKNVPDLEQMEVEEENDVAGAIPDKPMAEESEIQPSERKKKETPQDAERQPNQPDQDETREPMEAEEEQAEQYDLKGKDSPAQEDESEIVKSPPIGIEEVRSQELAKVKDEMADDEEVTNHPGALKDPNARALWSQISLEVSDKAFALSERLKLTLTENIANRLKGDYKTGKRLNIRKIISYIASSYRKDKIWMKRMRMSKREYQIVLAIDNSKSMALTKLLTLKTVALFTRAFTSLGIGDVGIGKFGTGFEMIKPLATESFGGHDQLGADLIDQLTFSETKTNVQQAIEKIVETLDQTKAMLRSTRRDSSTEFRQLVFVLSDGKFDSGSRTHLRSVVHDALRNNQFIVLILLDKDEVSISDTKRVEFINGKMTIRNYLEDFPFPFYVLIEHLETLPLVLSDTLQQWLLIAKNS